MLSREVKTATHRPGCPAAPFTAAPMSPALLRLAGALLIETHDEWQASDRHYPSEGFMAPLDCIDDPAARWRSRP
jgi:hypothetical protein